MDSSKTDIKNNREELIVKVCPEYHRLLYAILKVISTIPLLLISLVLYLSGILLTLTIIGAVIGIPLIVSTYAIDIIAISMLLNPRIKTMVVECPKCSNKKRVLPTVMNDFTCKKCKSIVEIRIIDQEE